MSTKYNYNLLFYFLYFFCGDIDELVDIFTKYILSLDVNILH
jgi:hypothetical protein